MQNKQTQEPQTNTIANQEIKQQTIKQNQKTIKTKQRKPTNNKEQQQ